MQIERDALPEMLGKSRSEVLARLGPPASAGTAVRPNGSVEVLRFRRMGYDRATGTAYDVEVTMRNEQVAEIFLLDTAPMVPAPSRQRR
jgi:hypothetical protein